MLYRVVLAIVLLAAVPAFAQPVPAPAEQSPTPARAPGGGMRERLQRVHDQLGITPAQQPQWDAVVGAMRENAAAMRANPAIQAARGGNLSAVQELHAAADVARARADALQSMIPSVEALYAALSPEQRHTADQTLDRMMHPGPRQRRG